MGESPVFLVKLETLSLVEREAYSPVSILRFPLSVSLARQRRAGQSRISSVGQLVGKGPHAHHPLCSTEENNKKITNITELA